MRRTHTCGELRREDVGKSVLLQGWVHSIRDHGGVLFIDLRDKSGLIQAVSRESSSQLTESLKRELKPESVLEVEGVVAERPEGTQNPNLPTGDVEVFVERFSILNPSKTPPFEISDSVNVSEETRLRYRYLDLRRPKMQKILRLRHQFFLALRKLLDEEGFTEVETPMLTKSTPEGARDFLVPSRLLPGNFFALPQSPQLFKQILMVAGVEKYFQIVRCFRDEDLRSDRQPEFTQLDLEMSFVEESDIQEITEKALKVCGEALGISIQTPFPRLTYQDALLRYGTDKPDMRFGCELFDLTEELKGCGFEVFASAVRSGGVIRGINLSGGAATTRPEIESLTEFAKSQGAKGLAWMKVTEKGLESSITKFFKDGEKERIREKAKAQAGDILFFAADQEKKTQKILGTLRIHLAEKRKLASGNAFKFLWVTNFPLFEFSDEEKRWQAVHHPFTAPKDEKALLSGKAEPAKLPARAYDLVLNGTEIGGGSIRIHRPEVQQRIFEILGISPDEARKKFGFLLEALSYGAPPHGGIALGLDRLLAFFLGEESIREVIPFPKTQTGTDLLSGAPSEVDEKQLRELKIRLDSGLKT